MPKIKINPDEIEKLAGNMDRISQRLSKLAGQATSVGLSAPSYDGQLKPRVISLANQMNSQVMQGSARTLQGSGKLKTISDRFKQADFQTDRVQRFLADLLVPPWLQWICERHYKTGDQYLNSLLALGSLYTGITSAKNFVVETFVWFGESLYDSLNGLVEKIKSLSPKRRIAEKMKNEFEKFPESETGKEIIEKAIAAGILFKLLDMDGNVIATIGDPKTATKEVPIDWVFNISTTSGEYAPIEKKINMNWLYSIIGLSFYKGVLIHEIQHAIDVYDKDIMELISEINNILSVEREAGQGLTDDEIATLENEYAKKWEFYVDTEIRAHDIGYDHYKDDVEAKLYGDLLNRHDEINTIEEKRIILEKRQYAINTYEPAMNEALDKAFPNGPKYTSKVSLDDEGNIKVKIILAESSERGGGGGGGGAW